MKPFTISIVGLFVFVSACKKEDIPPTPPIVTDTVYLTPLEESFLNFPINYTAVFGDYLKPPVKQFIPISLGVVKGFASINQDSDTLFEYASVSYMMEWLYPYYIGPPADMKIRVINKKLIINIHISGGMVSSEENIRYELDIQNEPPAFETLTFKDRVFNDVYILEKTYASDIYFNKDFGVVAFYDGNEFTYLKN